MSNFTFKKAILVGLGVLSFTREKAEEVAKDLIERGELEKTDEKKFINELMEKAKESKAVMEEKVEAMAKKALSILDIPTRKEFRELKEQVVRLSRANRKGKTSR